jgi:hypothetical protein
MRTARVFGAAIRLLMAAMSRRLLGPDGRRSGSAHDAPRWHRELMRRKVDVQETDLAWRQARSARRSGT